MSKIFQHASSSQPSPNASAPALQAAAAPSSPGAGAPSVTAGAGVTSASAASAPAASGGSAPAQNVDVAATLDALAKKNPEKLDWKNSIVDLMKLVGMDSSLSARKELAHDLKYSGDTSNSAEMNIWLHQEVMKQLAANGAKIPQELLKK